MRPKKHILVVDKDENRKSLLRFRLRIAHYDVFSADSAAEAHSLFAICKPELVIAASDTHNLAWLLKTLHELDPYAAQLVLAPNEVKINVIADAVLYNAPTDQVLKRVKIMATRMRGRHRAKTPVSEGRMDAERALIALGHIQSALGVELPDRRTA